MNNRFAYPPARPVKTVPLPPNSALTTLQSFLTATEKTPYLHPDALIHPGGISFASSGNGPSGGLILHHLRRIAAGLNGETLILEPDDLFSLYPGSKKSDDTKLDAEIARGTSMTKKRKGMNELDEFGTPRKSALKKRKIEDAYLDSEGEVLHQIHNGIGEDLQVGEDPEQWALKQGGLKGDVGDRDGAHGMTNGATQPPSVMAHQDVAKMDTGLSHAEKEARKLDKKKRRQEEKRAKEIKRAGG